VFLAEKCTFRSLSVELADVFQKFNCSHPDLNDFFANDSINYESQLLGKTYCFTLDESPDEIVCAFTVSNDSVKLKNLPKSSQRKIKSKFPHPKHLSHYPAVLIGRLGVNHKFHGKGIGRELMDFIKGWFSASNNKTGCRFIVVDSYNESNPLSYYQKNDFRYFCSTEEIEKENRNLSPEEALITRSLYFDLILLQTT